jgi:hypothetical protein
VALRGGLAIAAVKLGAKPYKGTVAHNTSQWQLVQAAIAAGNGTASVQALVAASVRPPMLAYLLRRGNLVGV